MASKNPSHSQNIFKGIVRCADCGRTMLVKVEHRRKRNSVLDQTFYCCSTYRKYGAKACDSHNLEARVLHEAVFADIQAHAKAAVSNREALVKKIANQMHLRVSSDRAQHKRDLKQCKARIAEIEDLYQENSGCGRIRLDQSSQYARSNHSAKAVRYGAGSFEAGHLRIERPADCKSIFGHRSLRRLWTEHGAAYRMDESKFEGVTKINDHEFELHNAHCFKIDVPQIGSAQAIYYDVAALKTCCEHIRKNHIPHPIVYIMACRIGPFAAHFYKEIHKLGGIVFRNPDGECEII